MKHFAFFKRAIPIAALLFVWWLQYQQSETWRHQAMRDEVELREADRAASRAQAAIDEAGREVSEARAAIDEAYATCRTSPLKTLQGASNFTEARR